MGEMLAWARDQQLEGAFATMRQDQVSGGDAQPVAALLGFRAVGVDHPHPAARRVDQQHAVGAHTQVAITEERGRDEGGVEAARSIDDQVVVAERLVLGQEEGIKGGHDALHRITSDAGRLQLARSTARAISSLLL